MPSYEIALESYKKTLRKRLFNIKDLFLLTRRQRRNLRSRNRRYFKKQVKKWIKVNKPKFKGDK